MVTKKRKRPTSSAPYSRSVKQKFGPHSILQLSLPSVAAYYNDHMNGVDIADHFRSNMHSDHRQRRGPAQALSWSFLLQTALANSFLLQLKGRPAWTPYSSQSHWQQALVNDIFRMYGQEGSSRHLYRPGNSFIPKEQHIFANRGVQSRCLACQGIQIGSRSQSQQHRQGQRNRGSQRPRNQGPLEQLDDDSLNSRAGPQSGHQRSQKTGTSTMWGCLTCNVAICKKPKCWDFYHQPIY